MKTPMACELCSAEAAVYCPSDAAFLCWSCDTQVHEANFLVARHIRQAICSNCYKLTQGGVYGVGFHSFTAECAYCPPSSTVDDIDSLSSDNSSACISSTTSPVKGYSGGRKDYRLRDCGYSSSVNEATSGTSQRVRSRADHFEAEGIFVNWSGKLGMSGDMAVRMASSALRVCLDRWKMLPFRVSLAASMWLGLRLGTERSALTWQVLKRLQEISGVPTKVIVAAESKLARALRAGRAQQRRRLPLEEGWAECSA